MKNGSRSPILLAAMLSFGCVDSANDLIAAGDEAFDESDLPRAHQHYTQAIVQAGREYDAAAARAAEGRLLTVYFVSNDSGGRQQAMTWVATTACTTPDALQAFKANRVPDSTLASLAPSKRDQVAAMILEEFRRRADNEPMRSGVANCRKTLDQGKLVEATGCAAEVLRGAPADCLTDLTPAKNLLAEATCLQSVSQAARPTRERTACLLDLASLPRPSSQVVEGLRAMRRQYLQLSDATLNEVLDEEIHHLPASERQELLRDRYFAPSWGMDGGTSEGLALALRKRLQARSVDNLKKAKSLLVETRRMLRSPDLPTLEAATQMLVEVMGLVGPQAEIPVTNVTAATRIADAASALHSQLDNKIARARQRLEAQRERQEARERRRQEAAEERCKGCELRMMRCMERCNYPPMTQSQLSCLTRCGPEFHPCAAGCN